MTFSSIIADRVGELWYDTPSHPVISWERAMSLPLEVDMDAKADWNEMGILRDHVVGPGDRVLEIGCHHGLTTVLLASWVGPTGHVQAFDAVLLNALVAKHNLELNRISHAWVFCAAIGGKRRPVRYDGESNVVVKKGRVTTPAATIMIRLEDAIEHDIDVLKLDVEGSELDILESSQKVVADIPRLAIELHTDLLPKDGVRRVLKCLRGRPLHVLWANGTFEPYRGQKIAERVHLFSF